MNLPQQTNGQFSISWWSLACLTLVITLASITVLADNQESSSSDDDSKQYEIREANLVSKPCSLSEPIVIVRPHVYDINLKFKGFQFDAMEGDVEIGFSTFSLGPPAAAQLSAEQLPTWCPIDNTANSGSVILLNLDSKFQVQGASMVSAESSIHYERNDHQEQKIVEILRDSKQGKVAIRLENRLPGNSYVALRIKYKDEAFNQIGGKFTSVWQVLNNPRLSACCLILFLGDAYYLLPYFARTQSKSLIKLQLTYSARERRAISSLKKRINGPDRGTKYEPGTGYISWIKFEADEQMPLDDLSFEISGSER